MYNVGMVLARGEVVLFCDSDAMVRERFIESVVTAFTADERLVLHLDQFRNVRQDLYPFSYPTFEEVVGPGCINNEGGRPRGLSDTADPLHDRNYGACMAARRADLMAIGGADEHLDYLGHICGPYEMTFRLINAGAAERWHPTEFLYHTWHPGQAGDGNYLGPHDGRHMSIAALEARVNGRIHPLLENPAVAMIRAGESDATTLEAHVIAPDRPTAWSSDQAALRLNRWTDGTLPTLLDHYKGYSVVGVEGVVFAVPAWAGQVDLQVPSERERPGILCCRSSNTVRAEIDAVLTAAARELVATTHPDLPLLVDEGYKGFNIIQFGACFYAIPQGEGEFLVDRVRRRRYSASYTGRTVASVKRLIDRRSNPPAWRTWMTRAGRAVRLLP
jgi:hypothetical protein